MNTIQMNIEISQALRMSGIGYKRKSNTQCRDVCLPVESGHCTNWRRYPACINSHRPQPRGVKRALYARWQRPILSGLRQEAEVRVGFEILRDGTVRNPRVDRSSGVPALDRSALRAVVDASPLPALPTHWTEPTLPAGFVFRLYPEEISRKPSGHCPLELLATMLRSRRNARSVEGLAFRARPRPPLLVIVLSILVAKPFEE